MKIGIIDYGLANIRSVVNAIECFDVQVEVVGKPQQLEKIDRIILPGVGSFDKGMQGLKKSGLYPALQNKVLQHKIPFLGICLGFQFLFELSAEGQEQGFGWLKGKISCFDKNSLKVPHMGWNEVYAGKSSGLFKDIEFPVDFYFVHSYFAAASIEVVEHAIGFTEYGEKFISAVQKEHIFGVQFHPEKSQLVGMKLLENFIFNIEYNEN